MIYHKQYLLHTDAPWVIFIHGAGGSSSIWYQQIRTFRQSFNLLLVDLRGHGKSAQIIRKYITEKYTFEDISEDIIEVMDHLKIKSANFVGMSLGTILIRTLAEKHPHRISTMVLGGAITRLNIQSQVLVSLGNAVKKFIPFMWLYKLLAFVIMPKKRHKKSRLLFIRDAKKIYKKEIQRWYKLLNDLNPVLRYFDEKKVDIPTLYLMGDEDYMFLGPVEKIVKEHRSATLQIVTNSGHVCNVDQPEKFNHYAIGFISKHNLIL